MSENRDETPKTPPETVMLHSKTLLRILEHWEHPEDFETGQLGTFSISLPFDIEAFCAEQDQILRDLEAKILTPSTAKNIENVKPEDKTLTSRDFKQQLLVRMPSEEEVRLAWHDFDNNNNNNYASTSESFSEGVNWLRSRLLKESE